MQNLNTNNFEEKFQRMKLRMRLVLHIISTLTIFKANKHLQKISCRNEFQENCKQRSYSMKKLGNLASLNHKRRNTPMRPLLFFVLHDH